jgi:MFS family permease
MTVDAFLRRARPRPWLFGWPTLEPLLLALFPAYGGAALFIVSPLFFDAPMAREWHVHETAVAGASTSMFACWIVGAVGWTALADRRGRRPAVLGSTWGSLILSAAAAASPNFVTFFVLRSALGLTLGGQGAVAYVLTLEWGLARDASHLTFISNIFFAACNLALVGIATGGAAAGLGWRVQQLLLCAVTVVPMSVACARLRESPRFLLSQDRREEAEAVLVRATGLSDCLLAGVVAEGGAADEASQPSVSGAQSSWRLLCEPTVLWRLFVVSCTWFTVNLIYYGLSFAPMTSSKALNALADLPGYTVAWALTELWGRRPTLVLTLGVAGGCLIGKGLADDAFGAGCATGAGLAFGGKVGASAAFQLAYIYPTELFPTPIRSTSLGVANVFGRIAAMLTPLASRVPKAVLGHVLGAVGLCVALLALTLPETNPQVDARENEPLARPQSEGSRASVQAQ